MLVPVRVEYVSEDDTLAEIAYREMTSSSLRKSNAILLALIAIFAYGFNILLATVIFVNKSLRMVNTYLLLGHFACINLIDLTFSVFFSLIFVANNSWIFGMTWCRIHAAIQEFCLLYTLISLMLLATERAIESNKIISLSSSNFHMSLNGFFTKKHLLRISFVLAIVSVLVTAPITSPAIPVKPFKNRFVCGIDSQSPIAYSVARIVLYTGALLVSVTALGAILKMKPESTLPSQPHDYNSFINRIRLMQEQKSLGRLIIIVFVLFVLTSSPYCVLSLVYEVANSAELSQNGPQVDIPQDADTLITWLKFLFPLISPMLIIFGCGDLRMKVRELFCCSPDSLHYGQHFSPTVNPPQIMTLVGTSNGLRFRENQLPANPQQTAFTNLVTPFTVDLPPKYENIDDHSPKYPAPATASPVTSVPVQSSSEASTANKRSKRRKRAKKRVR